jgi:methyl-accepting chemotaxis protein
VIVRLILVPVIFLSVYYLYRMYRIVDRIVNVDAPVATLAEQVSIKMLEARRYEQNYFLLRDRQDLEANQAALAQLGRIIGSLPTEAGEQATMQKMLKDAQLYGARMNEVAATMGKPRVTPELRMRRAIEAHQADLNNLLRRASQQSRDHLVQEIHTRLDSFDQEITASLEAQDPQLRHATQDLRSASNDIIRAARDLEVRGAERVSRDHGEARELIVNAEIWFIVVSSLTFILSVLASLILPREVVRPLLDLRRAVDHAAAGNYEIEFYTQGGGEVVQLANSVRDLIAHVRDKSAHTAVEEHVGSGPVDGHR